MKVSIITVCYNSGKYIRDTIESVINQTYNDIEYIIIDGGSDDDTINIIKSYGGQISKFVSEPDNGIYDAMNKGIKMASGEIIAILNSDDFYFNNTIIEEIAFLFSDQSIDGVYGDLLIVNRDNVNKIKRRYKADHFNLNSLSYGIMPGHATLFFRRKLFEKYGTYKTHYRIAADFELLVRFLYTHKVKMKYLPKIFLKARTGGVSDDGLFSKLTISKEVVMACEENNLKTNLVKINLRMLIKIKDLFFKSTL